MCFLDLLKFEGDYDTQTVFFQRNRLSPRHQKLVNDLDRPLSHLHDHFLACSCYQLTLTH